MHETAGQKTTLDLGDIQGFILRGYRMPMVRHFLLTVAVPAQARALLGRLVSGDESMRRRSPLQKTGTWGSRRGQETIRPIHMPNETHTQKKKKKKKKKTWPRVDPLNMRCTVIAEPAAGVVEASTTVAVFVPWDQLAHLHLVEAQPHERARGDAGSSWAARLPLRVTLINSLSARVGTARGHRQESGSRSSRNVERHQSPVPTRWEQREDFVELLDP